MASPADRAFRSARYPAAGHTHTHRSPHRQQAPFTCPFLGQHDGACAVYSFRPIACRTYGFYVQRDKGLFCSRIEAQVDRGEFADVVWGNHESVDHQLSLVGPARSLVSWFFR